MIVTSVKPIEEFYYLATEEEKEPQKQLFRRFKVVIRLDSDYMHYYNYNDFRGEYEYMHKTANPVTIMYNSQQVKDYTDKFIKVLGYDKIEEMSEQLKL